MVGERRVLLTDALRVAGRELMGDYASLWPLTKVLDIGGTARTPVYSGTGTTSSGSGEL